MRLNIDFRLRSEILSFSINGKPNPTSFTVYTYLLISAQYEDNMVNGISLKCGQALTSVRRLSANTGLTEKAVRIAIKHLIENGYIEQHSTRNYTIFTLCHYVTESKDTDSKGSITKQNIIGSSDTKQMNEQEKEDYYNQLVQKYMQGTLTAEEQKIFDEWK